MLAYKSTVVVAGTGLAGLRTVERLRQRGFGGRIVMFGAESHLPYDRPPLSKQILRGASDAVWLRSPEEYAALEVEMHLDAPATSLNLAGRTVSSSEGEQPFDVLVIATGARPRRVRELGGHVLRTLDDALGLRAALHPGVRLAIVGAGLIGCEVAASARALDVTVHLLDLLDAPIVRATGPAVAELVADLHRARGVQLHFGVTAERPRTGLLALSDGMEIGADTVLEAVGVTPDTEWLTGSGLVLADGVVCDGRGRAAEGVYAVGDVARWQGVRAEHWTNAEEQAAIVAGAVLGDEDSLLPVPYWWSDQYDIKIQGLGDTGNPVNEVQLLKWGPAARTVALYSRRGRLTGAVGFSAPGAVMGLRADIVNGKPVKEVAARLTG